MPDKLWDVPAATVLADATADALSSALRPQITTSALDAASTRTSTRRPCAAPTGMTMPSSSTRTWVSSTTSTGFSAVMTPGFDLPASWIIHAVGPIWSGGFRGEPELLAAAYRHCGVRPTVLERDFNIPPLDVLMQEVAVIRRLQSDVTAAQFAATPGVGS